MSEIMFEIVDEWIDDLQNDKNEQCYLRVKGMIANIHPTTPYKYEKYLQLRRLLYRLYSDDKKETLIETFREYQESIIESLGSYYGLPMRQLIDYLEWKNKRMC